jgi:hypothetical protein
MACFVDPPYAPLGQQPSRCVREVRGYSDLNVRNEADQLLDVGGPALACPSSEEPMIIGTSLNGHLEGRSDAVLTGRDVHP